MRKIAVALLASISLCSSIKLAYGDAVTVTAKVEPAVVFIRHRDSKGVMSSGSGFVISPAGYLVTCAHVVGQVMGKTQGGESAIADKVWVRLPDGSTHEADRCYEDDDYDVAVLKIPGDDHRFIELEETSLLQGEDVFVCGYPLGDALGKEMVVTRGIVSAIRAAGKVLQLDAAINPGNSGGPVLNKRGRVVGVAFARIPGFEGMNFAVASSAIPSLTKIALSMTGPDSSALVPSTYRSNRARRLLDEAKAHRESGSVDAEIRCLREVVADPLTGSFMASICYGRLADRYTTLGIAAGLSHDVPKEQSAMESAIECRRKAIEVCANQETACCEYAQLADTLNSFERFGEALEACKLAFDAIGKGKDGLVKAGMDAPIFVANTYTVFEYDTWCEMGEAQGGLGQYDAALDSLSRAVSVKTDDSSEAHFQTGVIYVRMKDKTRALNELAILRGMKSLSRSVSLDLAIQTLL